MRKKMTKQELKTAKQLRIRWLGDERSDSGQGGLQPYYIGQIYTVLTPKGEELGTFLYWEDGGDYAVYIGSNEVSDDGEGSLLDAAWDVYNASKEAQSRQKRMRETMKHITTEQTEKDVWEVQVGCGNVIGWILRKGDNYLMDFDDNLGSDKPKPLRIGEASTLEDAAFTIYEHGWELEKQLRRQFA